MYLCRSSHLYELFLETYRKRPAGVLTLAKISIPPHSVFFGHGFIYFASSRCRKTHDLRNHLHFIPVQNILKDAIAFANRPRSSH